MHMTGICEVVTGTDSVPAFSVAAFCGTVFFSVSAFLLLLLLLQNFCCSCCCCSFAIVFVAVTIPIYYSI